MRKNKEKFTYITVADLPSFAITKQDLLEGYFLG